MNTDGGTIHLDKISVKYDKHEEVEAQKPGFAHIKLKKNLYEKIRDKRRQELLKRLEEAEKIKKEAEAGNC